MLRTVAVILLLITKLVHYIVKYEYFGNLFEFLLADSIYLGWEVRLSATMYVWVEVLMIALLMLTLFSPTIALRDKAYKLLRILMVTYYVMCLPYWIATLFGSPGTQDTGMFIYNAVSHAIKIFCMVVFMAAKPAKPVPRINTLDYELISPTSNGHRLLHLVVDILILAPILFQVYVSMSRKEEGVFMNNLSVFLFFGGYFIYYTLSEALFGQTFGKVFTNSCVAGNGVRLTTGRIICRNLLRYFPADAVIFVFGHKWHDKISSTTVVYIDSWEKAFEEDAQELKTAAVRV
jgi:hypothetical protein